MLAAEHDVLCGLHVGLLDVHSNVRAAKERERWMWCAGWAINYMGSLVAYWSGLLPVAAMYPCVVACVCVCVCDLSVVVCPASPLIDSLDSAGGSETRTWCSSCAWCLWASCIPFSPLVTPAVSLRQRLRYECCCTAARARCICLSSGCWVVCGPWHHLLRTAHARWAWAMLLVLGCLSSCV